MKKEEVLNNYMAALAMLHRSATHLILIENEIGKFEYSKPVNIAHKKITEIEKNLIQNLEKMTRHKLIDLNRRVRIKVEWIKNPSHD